MKKILLFLFLTSVCFGVTEVSETATWYDSGRDFFFSISASESMTESIGYIFAPDGGEPGQALLTDGGDPVAVITWGVPTTSASHNLGSTTHDATTFSATRGSIIIGNATPLWSELVIGAANEFLKSDGTDVDWGFIDISDSTNLAVDTDHLKLTDDTLSFSDNEKVVSHARQDSFLEQIDFTISEAGGTVTGSLEKEGGGDLTQFWSDDFDDLDCTGPVCTVDLTAFVGTDTSPAAAFVYILQSAKTVLVANTSWPANTVEHIRIASIVLQSAATTGTEGVLMNRNWNDMSFGITNPKGGNVISNERMRKNHAQWDSGVVLSITGSGTGTVTLDTTAGVVYQLNPQVFPAVDMAGADNIHLANLSGSEFSTSINLVADITTLANGSTSLGNNKYFNLVIWGVQNRTGETSHLMCNLPIGQYGKQGDATIDAEKFSVHTIPDNFRGTGFLIAELTFQFISGPTWTLIQNKDLLGQFPILIPGGGTTNNITTFVDSSFEIFDNLDDTKRIAFQASSVGAGNTSIITMPDANIDLGLLDVTPGTAEASKALIVDSNIDIGTIRNLTATGTVEAEHLHSTDDLVVDNNITMSGSLLTLGDAGLAGTIVIDFFNAGHNGQISFDEFIGQFFISEDLILAKDLEVRGGLTVTDPSVFEDSLLVQETLTLGVQDSINGDLVIFASGPNGGIIKVHVEGDSDATIVSYDLQTVDDDFLIGSDGDPDMLKFIAETSIQSTVPFDVDAALSANSFTDGTTTITGGNYTGVGNITGGDLDIQGGTGFYHSSGGLFVGTAVDTTNFLTKFDKSYTAKDTAAQFGLRMDADWTYTDTTPGGNDIAAGSFFSADNRTFTGLSKTGIVATSTVVTGLFGGAASDVTYTGKLDNTVGSYSLRGVQYFVTNRGTFADTDAASSTTVPSVVTTGSKVISAFGMTVDKGAGNGFYNFESVGYHAQLASHFITVTSADEVIHKTYGFIIELDHSGEAGSIISTSHGLFNACPPAADTNYFLHDDFGVDSIHTGNLRVGGGSGGAADPTVALDVTGDVDVTGDYYNSGNQGLSATYNFGGGGTGDIATMTFTGGILTGVTTVP